MCNYIYIVQIINKVITKKMLKWHRKKYEQIFAVIYLENIVIMRIRSS